MKPRYWSLAIVLILVNYLIFATLFTWLLETDFSVSTVTRTPVPTFTPAPAEPIIIVPTNTPAVAQPTPTATKVLAPAESHAPNPGNNVQASVVQPAPAQLVAPGAVNIRAGSGLNHNIIGKLNPNTTMPIIGRNVDSSWWKIEITQDITGWVSNGVVKVSNIDDVSVVDN